MRLAAVSAAPVVALATFGAVVAGAPPAAADCVSTGGTTICSQGDVRGSDTDAGPSGTGPSAPYPCEYDWYCNDGFGVGVVIGGGDGDVGLPGTPGNRPPQINNRPSGPRGGAGGGRRGR